MRKFSLLMGALGGAMAGYLLSNDKLREEMMNAKSPEHAAKALGKHLQKDGKKVVGDVQAFVRDPSVQENIGKAKKFALVKFREAKKGAQAMVKKGEKSVVGMMKDGRKAAKKGFKETKV